MLLSNAAIKNRTTVFVLMLLVVLTGVHSYITLPREAAPDVPIPIIMISTLYDGVAPEDVESSLTLKIEQELTGISGLEEIRSKSQEGMSLIEVEFQPDVDIKDARREVNDALDQAKPELPPEAEEPFITEINIAEFPIMTVNISGEVSPVRMKMIADELEDAIEKITGVLDVEVYGELEREIRLEFDKDRLAAYSLTLPEIMQLIPSENVNISAGGLETAGTKFNVRLPAEFVTPEEVDMLPLAVRDGRTIYLSDVATVVDTFKDRDSYSRLDGEPSVTLAIKKQIGANIIFITESVQAVLAEARTQLPQAVRLAVTDDRSEDIRMIVKDLENNIFSGLVLVLIVLTLFMGLRSSLIVALAIPMSMLISFAVIQAIGFTLNMIVLFSLILALGMLVDNAIVIVENIFRHTQMGYGKIEAAMKGTAEVAWPVTTSTATTVAAFLPLAFWPGIMGDFMKYLPITVIIVLTSSLFVALVINPTVCSFFAAPRHATRKEHGFLTWYRRMLGGLLGHWSHRLTALACAGLVLVFVGMLYARLGAGVEFFPNVDPKVARVDIRMPQGTNIKETNRVARRLERRVEKHRDDIKHVITNVGTGGGDELSAGSTGPHLAQINIVFYDYEVRDRWSNEIITELRPEIEGIAGAEIRIDRQEHGPPTGAPVTIRISGREFDTLKELSRQIKREIVGVPGLVNLRSDLEATRPELAFVVDRRRATLLGVSPMVIGNFLKTAIFGSEVGTFRQFNDEYDITVRLPEAQRVAIDDLLNMQLPNTTGRSIPLSSLGHFEYRGGFGTIHRVDQKRVVTVTADNEDRMAQAVLDDVQNRVGAMDIPPGYAIRYAGEEEEQLKAQAFLGKAFVVALLLIVLILVTQFNTLSVPIIIMTTVVLSLVGVFAGLLITDMPFGIIMTGIGVISLAGVVVNNAIVLLDYTRQLQRRGMELVEAAIEAGATRLRPVLLTATTTILGLIPMAVGISFDVHTFDLATRSEMSVFWRSMATAVIFGLAFSTVLTLAVVPILYVSIYKIAHRFGFGGLRRPEAEHPPTEPQPAPAINGSLGESITRGRVDRP